MKYDSQNRTITTSRLVLRLFEKSDAEAVALFCDNIKIYCKTLHIPYPYTVQDALTWMERHLEQFEADKMYEFAVTDRNTGELYGSIALSNNQRDGNGELGYWMGEPYWGRGYATEAAQALLQFAFTEKNYHKVYARHFASNPASGRVLVKLGMEKEGVLKEHVRKDGRYEDLVYYGVTRLRDL